MLPDWWGGQRLTAAESSSPWSSGLQEPSLRVQGAPISQPRRSKEKASKSGVWAEHTSWGVQVLLFLGVGWFVESVEKMVFTGTKGPNELHSVLLHSTAGAWADGLQLRSAGGPRGPRGLPHRHLTYVAWRMEMESSPELCSNPLISTIPRTHSRVVNGHPESPLFGAIKFDTPVWVSWYRPPVEIRTTPSFGPQHMGCHIYHRWTGFCFLFLGWRHCG